MVPSPYVILGCGYTGTRLACALLRDGVAVRACARRVALLEPLSALGADVRYLDASKPRQFLPMLQGLSEPVVVYSIPGVMGLPPGEAVRWAAEAALTARARAFIYLGTTGVYGRSSGVAIDEWIDEESAVDVSDPEMGPRLGDEGAVMSAVHAGLRGIVLRLSAIYGPPALPGQSGRGVRQRLRKGEYRLWDGGRYYFSRIHVDDLVAVIRAAAERAPKGALYVVGDDHPCPQGEYGRWLAAHLGLPEPPEVDSLAPGIPRPMIRGRRICNRRMKDQLGLTLLYPSYREGERQIDMEEQGEAGSGAPTCHPISEEAPAQVEARPARVSLAEDLGGQLGGAPVGVEIRHLPAGARPEAGLRHVLLSEKAGFLLGGRETSLSALDILPEGAVPKEDVRVLCVRVA